MIRIAINHVVLAKSSRPSLPREVNRLWLLIGAIVFGLLIIAPFGVGDFIAHGSLP